MEQLLQGYGRSAKVDEHDQQQYDKQPELPPHLAAKKEDAPAGPEIR
jgi:hypothetical protein